MSGGKTGLMMIGAVALAHQLAENCISSRPGFMTNRQPLLVDARKTYRADNESVEIHMSVTGLSTT